MTKYILFTIFINVILANFNDSKADISWIKGAETCEEFSPALKGYLDRVDLSMYSLLPLWQKEEISIVLNQACNGKFSVCNLSTCKKWSSLSKFKALNNSNKKSWLSRFLTCEQLMEQVKSRYSNLDVAQQNNTNTKREIKLVLNTACSERFSHCKFSSCKSLNKDSKIGELAIEKKSKSFNHKALQQSIINQSIKKEKALGLVWQKFTNSEEAQILARRREEVRRRKIEEREIEEQKDFNRPNNRLWTRPKNSSSTRSNNRKTNRRKTGISPF